MANVCHSGRVTANPPTVTRRAWLVWSVGVLAYVIAVMQRTTFGIAGLDAAQRFEITPGALSAFVFVQLAVYIAAQIPAGLLVDRFGAKAMLVASGTLLAAGQLLLAIAADLPLAVLARVLVGLGDAAVFVAVLALVPRWFPERRVPLVIQVTTILCQLGQVLSAVPFAALLHGLGWPVAFGAAAIASGLAAGLTLGVVRDAPPGTPTPVAIVPARAIIAQVGTVWRRPGTRLGFFGHVGTQFPMMVFTLLWGVPYLVTAQGLSVSTASGLLTLFVACTIVIGPVLGVLTMRHPRRRPTILLVVIGAEVGVWTAVLLTPAPAPGWLLVLLIVVLAAAGPGSVVGIDIARTANPSGNLGVAQSMVNLGGFTASLIVLATMGAVLTALGGFTPDAFRVAWQVQYPVWAIAAIGILIMRRRVDASPEPLADVRRPARTVT